MSRAGPWSRAGWVLSSVLVLTAATPVVPMSAPGHTLAAPTPMVEPATVDLALVPGESATVAKTVHTPVVPPRPDIVLLVDGTGSMGDAITDVKDNLSAITERVQRAQPDARFAVASYGDIGDPFGRLFRVLQSLTADVADVRKAVGLLDARFGGDTSEDWINALFQVSQGAAGEFRAGGSPIVVLVGDASSHDPSNDVPLDTAIEALAAARIKVLAVEVDTGGDGLDGDGKPDTQPPHEGGQATAVVGATGGSLLRGVDPGEVAATIGAGLTSLPTTVTHGMAGCDPRLSVTLDPASRTVTSGDDATFTETITASDDAPQGTTLTCAVQFGITAPPEDGAEPPDADDLRETISVAIRDVTSPVVTVDDMIAVASISAGAFLTYTVTAVDAVDGSLAPACTPRSGALFPVGRTTITCVATDKAGNSATDSAVITVLPKPPPPTADLGVKVQLAPALAFVGGGSVQATMTVTNAGPVAATGVVLTVSTPRPANPAARTVSALSACAAASPCTLQPGTHITVTLSVTYRDPVIGTVRATVSGTPADPRPTDNTAFAALTVLKPTLQVTPRVAKPGQVVLARGTGFPPGTVVVLGWMSGITAAHQPIVVGRDGTFTGQVLILRKDRLGLRVMQASGPGYAPLKLQCLVVPRGLPPELGGG